LRSVDKRRLAGKMGEIDLAKWHPVLLEMLA
jgi:mRNA interferase MazF